MTIALECAFKQYFLVNDKLWIFGSRADLTKKGGDIDLYIETHAQNSENAMEMNCSFVCRLKETLGDQKIDVVLNVINDPHHLPIYEVALTEGVRII